MKNDAATPDQNPVEDLDLLTLEDEDGKEHQFELADSVELDGTEYYALIPVYETSDELLEDSGELIIMRVAEENGEEFLDPVEDDEEYARVSAVFTERLAELYDFDDSTEE